MKSDQTEQGFVITTVAAELESLESDATLFDAQDCRTRKLEYNCHKRFSRGDTTYAHQININRVTGKISEIRLVSPESRGARGHSFEGTCEKSEKPRF